MKFLITGGFGLIGSRMCQLIRERYKDAEIVICDMERHYLGFLVEDRHLYASYFTYRSGLTKDATIYNVDTRHSFEMNDILDAEKPDVIVHLAALPLAGISRTISQEAFSSICESTTGLLECMRRTTPNSRFIFISSSMVYGDFEMDPMPETGRCIPKSMYGASKLAGEVISFGFGRTYNLDVRAVRPSAVYGPGDINQRVVELFIQKAKKGQPIHVKGAHSKLDFTYVDDIANGIIDVSVAENQAFEAFNITSGDPRTLGELIAELQKYFPDMDVRYDEFDTSVPVRGGLDVSKAREKVGYIPKFDFETGIRTYLDIEARIIGND